MKQIFSKGIYKEMLRATRTCAMIFLAIGLIVVAIATYMNVTDYRAMTESDISLVNSYAPYEDQNQAAGILPYYIYAMGFALPLVGFSFLKKRNASDFYHGLPYSRTSLFISTFLACVTWIIIDIVAIYAASIIGVVAFGMKYYARFIPQILGFCIIGTVFVCSVTSLAAALSGTSFTNIILVGLIGALPRFILVMAALAIESRTQNLVSIGNLGFLFNFRYNIPVGLVLSIFDYNSLGGMYTFYGSYIYTGILTVLYTVLGAFSFAKRKSETAGNSAPGKTLQTIYRCAIGLPGLIVIAMCFILEDGEPELLLWSFVFSIVPFLLFELISTRSAKNMVKAIPSYFFVIAATLVFSAITVVSSNIYINDVPHASKVASVQFDITNGGYFMENYDYSEIKAEDVKFDNSEMINIAVNDLKYTTDLIHSDRRGPVSDVCMLICFNLKNGSKLYRNITMPQNDQIRFLQIAEETAEYKNALSALPSDKEIEIIKLDASVVLSEQEKMILWNSYKSEYDATVNDGNEIFSFIINGFVGKKAYESTFTCLDYMTKTVDMYIKYVNEAAPSEDKVEGYYTKFTDARGNSDYDGQMSMEVVFYSDMEYIGFDAQPVTNNYVLGYNLYEYKESQYDDDYEDEQTQRLKLLTDILNNSERADKVGENTVSITSYIYMYDMIQYTNFSKEWTVIYELSDEDMSKLSAIIAFDGSPVYDGNYYEWDSATEKMPEDIQPSIPIDEPEIIHDVTESEDVTDSDFDDLDDKAKEKSKKKKSDGGKSDDTKESDNN